MQYLAEKQRREGARREKRKRDLEAEEAAEERRAKAAKVEIERQQAAEKKRNEILLEVLEGVLTQRAIEGYKVVYGPRWEEELSKAMGEKWKKGFKDAYGKGWKGELSMAIEDV